MITVAIVMLIVSILGLYLSILGHKNAIHLFIIGGWLLIVVTFILCGVFIILNNAISDTCLAMEQWVNHPHAETALSNILPCVDQGTTNQTLYKSKQVINDLGNIVNGFIGSYANSYAMSSGNSNYYNLWKTKEGSGNLHQRLHQRVHRFICKLMMFLFQLDQTNRKPKRAREIFKKPKI